MAVTLKVVKGDATPEELAAVVAVLAARASAAGDEPTPKAPSVWGSPQLRGPLPVPGDGAWQLSGRRL